MPSTKQTITIAAVALLAVAVAYRIPKVKEVVFDDGSLFG